MSDPMHESNNCIGPKNVVYILYVLHTTVVVWAALVALALQQLNNNSLSSLLPFSVPRAQEFSLHRAQQHRPIVVYNPQQQVINYIRAQFKNQRLSGLSAFLSLCKIPFNKVVTDPVVFTWRLWDEGFRLLQNTRQTVVLDCISCGQKQNHQTNK